MSITMFFDTETNGLPKNYKASYKEVDNWPRVVQLAWVMKKDDVVLSTNSFILSPEGITIPADASKVHGITEEIATLKGVDRKSVFRLFANSISLVDRMVAHNFAFDAPVVSAELLRYGISVDDSKRVKICTMRASAKHCNLKSKVPGQPKWPKLEELHQKLFMEGVVGAHNALSDVEATIRCYDKLVTEGIISPAVSTKMD